MIANAPASIESLCRHDSVYGTQSLRVGVSQPAGAQPDSATTANRQPPISDRAIDQSITYNFVQIRDISLKVHVRWSYEGERGCVHPPQSGQGEPRRQGHPGARAVHDANVRWYKRMELLLFHIVDWDGGHCTRLRSPNLVAASVTKGGDAACHAKPSSYYSRGASGRIHKTAVS